MNKKKILVCGTGFGKIYLKTIMVSEQYELAGILGRGSTRTRKLAGNLNVPVYTDIADIGTDVDAACVVVPNAAGGGNGSEIAEKLLLKGIPTLLEHPAHAQEIVKCLRASKDVPFMLNPFYRYIEPVRNFLKVAELMSKSSKLINATLECAIHVLYDGLDILGCALGDLSVWKLGTVAEIPVASLTGGGNKSLGAVIGSVPVMLTVNTNVDKDDPDHPLHLYHRIELTFSTGRLCLVNTHGPVVWMPFLRMPRDEHGTMDIDEGTVTDIPSGLNIGEAVAASMRKTFDEVWPGAVKQALDCLFTQDQTKKLQMAQYQIYVSKLWSEVSRKIGYINFVDFDADGNVKELFNKIQKCELLKEKK